MTTIFTTWNNQGAAFDGFHQMFVKTGDNQWVSFSEEKDGTWCQLDGTWQDDDLPDEGERNSLWQS